MNIPRSLSALEDSMKLLKGSPVKSLLLLCDDHDVLTDLRKNKLIDTFEKCESLVIPVMNELVENEFPYVPENEDVIITGSFSQQHLAFLLDQVAFSCTHLGLSSVYLFHPLPNGEQIEVRRIVREGHSTNIEAMKINHVSSNQLENLFFFNWSSARPTIKDKPILKRSIINEFASLEQMSNATGQVRLRLAQIYERQGEELDLKDYGDMFEEVSSDLLLHLDSVRSVVVSVESKLPSRPFHREEDIFAYTINGRLLFVSCKFLRPPKYNLHHKVKEAREEVERLRDTVLPLGLPEQRIAKVLITSTPILSNIGDTGDVIVTNLSELPQKIEHL